MKPDWKDAPECARFLAKDEDGEWFWYEEKPVIEGNRWVIDQYIPYSEAYFAGHDHSWKDSLEARPDDAEKGKE